MGGGNRFASNKEVLVWATFFFFFFISLQCAGFLFAIGVCSFFSHSLCSHMLYFIYTFLPLSCKRRHYHAGVGGEDTSF